MKNSETRTPERKKTSWTQPKVSRLAAGSAEMQASTTPDGNSGS